jgi:hypothetical protein
LFPIFGRKRKIYPFKRWCNNNAQGNQISPQEFQIEG